MTHRRTFQFAVDCCTFLLLEWVILLNWLEPVWIFGVGMCRETSRTMLGQKWPPGSLALVRQQVAHQSSCCPQSPRDCCDIDKSGLLVLIIMGKGVGVVFLNRESTLSLYIICKHQPLYNNFGDGESSFLWFCWFYCLLCKTIPQHSWHFRSRLIHLGS